MSFTAVITQLVPVSGSWTAIFEREAHPVVCWALTGELEVVGLIALDGNESLTPVDLAAANPALGAFVRYA